MIASSSIFVANKIYEQMILISGKAAPVTSPVKSHLSERFLLEVLSQDMQRNYGRQVVSSFSSPNSKPVLSSSNHFDF